MWKAVHVIALRCTDKTVEPHTIIKATFSSCTVLTLKPFCNELSFGLMKKYAYRTTGEKAAADIVLARKEASRERARMACRIISQRPMYMFALDNDSQRANPRRPFN